MSALPPSQLSPLRRASFRLGHYSLTLLSLPLQQDVRILFRNWVFSFCSPQLSILFDGTTVPLDMTIDSSTGLISIPSQPESLEASMYHICVAATNSFAYATMVHNPATHAQHSAMLCLTPLSRTLYSPSTSPLQKCPSATSTTVRPSGPHLFQAKRGSHRSSTQAWLL